MTRVTASTTEEDLLSGKLWTVQYTTGSMAATTGEEIVGFTIGAKDVIYQARTYTGTCTDVLATLYQNTWSGGTPLTASNRNFRITSAGPVSYSSGITGTPSVFKTSIRLVSAADKGGVGSVPEGEWYILTAGASYVLRIQNLGGSVGFVNFRFTYKAID